MQIHKSLGRHIILDQHSWPRLVRHFIFPQKRVGIILPASTSDDNLHGQVDRDWNRQVLCEEIWDLGGSGRIT